MSVSYALDWGRRWQNGDRLKSPTTLSSRAPRQYSLSIILRQSLTLPRRIAPGQTGADVREALTSACDATAAKFPELKYEIIPVEAHGMPSFEVDPNSRIVRSLNTAYAAVRGAAQPTGAITPICFYGSDAGHLYRKLGMEGVVCGPGGKYNTMPVSEGDTNVVHWVDFSFLAG